MKLKDHLGYKRLAMLITFGSFVISYFLLILVNADNINSKGAFIIAPIISGVFALIAYIFIRGVYWVVDGFRKAKEPSANNEET